MKNQFLYQITNSSLDSTDLLDSENSLMFTVQKKKIFFFSDTVSMSFVNNLRIGLVLLDTYNSIVNFLV